MGKICGGKKNIFFFQIRLGFLVLGEVFGFQIAVRFAICPRDCIQVRDPCRIEGQCGEEDFRILGRGLKRILWTNFFEERLEVKTAE